MDEQEYRDQLQAGKSREGRYQWAVTTLVGIICLFLGLYIQAERYAAQVGVTKVQIETLDKRLASIEAKLEKLADERQKP